MTPLIDTNVEVDDDGVCLDCGREVSDELIHSFHCESLSETDPVCGICGETYDSQLTHLRSCSGPE